MSETATPEGGFKLIDFWMKNKRWIYPTVVGVVAYFGGNPDNIPKWVPELPGADLTKRVETLEANQETLYKTIAAHDKALENLQPVRRLEEDTVRE